MVFKNKCEVKYHKLTAKVKKKELIGQIHLKVAYDPSAAVMAILAMLDFHFTYLSAVGSSFTVDRLLVHYCMNV